MSAGAGRPSPPQVEAQDDLTVGIEVSSRDEPVARVEAGRATLTGHVAGEQFRCSVRPHQLHDLPQDLLAVALPLVVRVDEQLPQEPRPVDVRRLRLHVPAQHDEPDGVFVCVNGSVPRVPVGVRGRLGNRVGDGADEPFLLGRGAHCENRVEVGLGDLAQGDRHSRHARAAEPVCAPAPPSTGCCTRPTDLRCGRVSG